MLQCCSSTVQEKCASLQDKVGSLTDERDSLVQGSPSPEMFIVADNVFTFGDDAPDAEALQQVDLRDEVHCLPTARLITVRVLVHFEILQRGVSTI